MLLAFGAKMLGLFGVGDAAARKFAWGPLLLLALLALWGAKAAWGSFMDRTIETAKQAGAQGAVIAGQETTLKQIGDAHDAANAIRSDAGFARYCQCVRDSAPGFGGSCTRYLENKPVPGGQPDADKICASGGN